MKKEKFYAEPVIEIIGLLAEQVFATSTEVENEAGDENLYLGIEEW